jgi:HEAT repeat protein
MGAVPPSTTQEATAAVNAIGTNALPTLLFWLSYEQGKAKDAAGWFLDHAPLGKQTHRALALRLHVQDQLLLPALANSGFEILGTNAQPAIPQLVRIAKGERHQTIAHRAVVALGRIGPPALPALTQLLSDTNCPVRGAVVIEIAHFATNSPSVGPMILQLTSDPSPAVSCAAAGMVGNIGIPHELAVPVLVKALASQDTGTRRLAAFSLGQYTTQAVEAVPALRQLLLDPHYLARNSATNALLKIAPEVLTNSATK